MIETYANKLADNLPIMADPSAQPIPTHIDVVLEGGLFNGSYLVGALYFLREMEHRHYIHVERISGCSVGSLVAFLYFIHSLDLFQSFYAKIKDELKATCRLTFLRELKEYLKDRIPTDICRQVNGRLYICYHHILKQKKVVRSRYKNTDDLLETIVRSCYVPFLAGETLLHREKYLDGLNAYIFDPLPHRKILYLELFNYDKWSFSLNVKNEKNNWNRVLSGLLETHNFYVKQMNTPMCSYVDEWGARKKVWQSVKRWLERIVVVCLAWSLKGREIIERYMPCGWDEGVAVKLAGKIVHMVLTTLLNEYYL